MYSFHLSATVHVLNSLLSSTNVKINISQSVSNASLHNKFPCNAGQVDTYSGGSRCFPQNLDPVPRDQWVGVSVGGHPPQLSGVVPCYCVYHPLHGVYHSVLHGVTVLIRSDIKQIKSEMLIAGVK